MSAPPPQSHHRASDGMADAIHGMSHHIPHSIKSSTIDHILPDGTLPDKTLPDGMHVIDRTHRGGRNRLRAALALVVCMLAPGLAPAIELRGAEGIALEGFAMDIGLEGRYVSVTVEATISGPSLIEGELRFPLPPGAVLHETAVFVPDDERWAVAETLGRRQGRQVFDSTPSEPRTSPLLVQQIGRDFYRAKVHAPDEAESLRLRIRYAHLVERSAEGYALRIALANPDLGRSRPAALSVHLEAPAGWRVRGMRGPGLAQIDDDRAVLVDPENALDDDLWIDLEPLAEPGRIGGLAYRPAAAHEDAADAVRARLSPHTHVHVLPDLSHLAASPRRMVLVLDRSGSMGGQKLAEARRGVARVVERMGPGDRFSIVAFDTGVMRFSDALVGPERVPEALAFLDGVSSGGGTDIFQALSAAAAIADDRADIVLITDGRPNAGFENAPETLAALEAEARDLRIHVFGIGHDLDQRYLTALAAGSGGEVAFALDDGEIAGDLFALCDQAVDGGVRDGALYIDGEQVWSGRILPGQELQAAVRGDRPAAVRIDGNTAAGLLDRQHDLPPLSIGAEGLHRVVPPLAAKAWADALEREIDLEGETVERVDAAVRLARAYGIITRYSSHLALTDEADYAERGIDRIARDPAGIALDPVDGAEENEGRIGGEGVPGDDADGDGIVDAPAAFGADAGAPPPDGQWAGDAGGLEPDPSAEAADGAVVGCSANPGHGPTLPIALALLGLVVAAARRRA